MKDLLKIKISSIEETERLGYIIGKVLNRSIVISMTGDLGAGKTTLTQSIAKGLSVDDYITSPTFTIINEYVGRLPLYHFDVYRINDLDEMYDLGYEEYFYSEGVVIIEWANIIEELLPKERVHIEIKKIENNSREIIIRAIGEKYLDIIKNIEEELKKDESLSYRYI